MQKMNNYKRKVENARNEEKDQRYAEKIIFGGTLIMEI